MNEVCVNFRKIVMTPDFFSLKGITIVHEIIFFIIFNSRFFKKMCSKSRVFEDSRICHEYQEVSCHILKGVLN